MDLLLLGPIEARRDNRPIALGAPKQRALLAMLALEVGRTVSADRLAAGLWGDEPPSSAPKMVQLYVSQLRRVIGGNDAEIVTRGRGYELRLAADQVDVVHFEHLLDSSRPREALALWRGDALADIADEPFAAPEIRRLEALRLRASEEAIDADLAAGRHREVIGELEALTAQHPLREPLHAQLMLALYRGGRQAEALDAYVAARRHLVEDVGIEPGAELQDLQARMLRQDPSLRLSETVDTAPPQPATRPAAVADAPSPARRVPVGFVIALVAILVGAAAIATVIRFTDQDSLEQIDANSVGVINPETGGIMDQYTVGREPTALAAGGGSVWVANARDGTVTRIDREGEQLVTIPVGAQTTGLTFAAGSLWVTDRLERTVSRVDPVSNRVAQTIKVGNAPRGIAAGFGALWVASEVDRTVARIDLASAKVTRRIDLGANPVAIAAGAGAIWAASEEGGTVFRIDPGSATVLQSISVGNGPVALAVGEGAVWVANRQDGTVSRIDPATDAVTDTAPVGGDPSAITAGDGDVWVANRTGGTVLRLDPGDSRPAETIDVESSPTAIALSDGSVWTAALAAPASHRGGTLRVEALPFGLARLSHGNYGDESYGLLQLAYDGLVTYRRVGGATFGGLVGNLATGVPSPSPDGLTYIFRLRPGIRYANGRIVQPEDVRASLEDFLRRRGSVGPGPVFQRIVGAQACSRLPRCDLSKGVVTDSGARTVTIRLTEPDSELMHKLAQPAGFVTPADEPFNGSVRPSGTGPYHVAAYRKTGARLVRNPHFRVWSNDARPDGLVDEIVVRARGGTEAQVAAVQRGEADVVTVADQFGPRIPLSRLATIRTRPAGQLFTDAAAELDYMFLNTRRPPFDDPRVRRAINYAVDRQKIAELAGGADLAQLTCQYVPTGFPTHKPSCPYTLDPDVSGGWTAPARERAQRLIDRSGTAGTSVAVWANRQKASIARYFAALLRDLGYRSSLRLFPDYFAYRTAIADSAAKAQLGVEGWSADIGAPSNFTPPFLCRSFAPRSPANGNLAGFCDRRIDARVDAALSDADPDTDAQWQAVYRRLSGAAPAVPLVNRRSLTLVSDRVGNYQHHPLWQTLLDQLWVR